ncbi:MAG: hypothetical protein EA401_10035, partial [Planctomycetota bacterium]
MRIIACLSHVIHCPSAWSRLHGSRILVMLCCTVIAITAITATEQSHGEEASGLRIEYFKDRDLQESLGVQLHPGPWIENRRELTFYDDRPRAEAVCWTGNLHVPADGTYQFHYRVDYALKVWIGEELVIDEPRYHNQMKSTDLELTAGPHPIRVEYISGGNGLQMFWESNDLQRQRLDQAHLTTPPWSDMRLVDREAFHLEGPQADQRVSGLRGRYFAGEHFEQLVHQQRDTHVSILGNFPIPSGRLEQFSARWSGVLEVPQDGTYTFAWQSGADLWMEIGHRRVVSTGVGEGSVEVELSQGLHPLSIVHSHDDGNAYLQMHWHGPGVDEQVLGGKHVSTLPWDDMQDAKPMLILIMTGHSNMRGTIPDGIDSYHPRTWEYRPDRMARWRRVHTDKSGMGPLLKELAEANPGVQFGAVKITRDSGTLQDDFTQGNRTYRQLIDEGLVAQEGHRIAAVVTKIGWLETRGHGSPLTVLEDFGNMIDGFRDEFNDPHLPFVLSQVVESNDSQENDTWHAVRAAINRVPQFRDNVVIVPANQELIDHHHYNAEGYQLWAAQATEQIQEVGLVEHRLADDHGMSIEQPAVTSVEPSPQGTIIVKAELEQATQPRD